MHNIPFESHSITMLKDINFFETVLYIIARIWCFESLSVFSFDDVQSLEGAFINLLWIIFNTRIVLKCCWVGCVQHNLPSYPPSLYLDVGNRRRASIHLLVGSYVQKPDSVFFSHWLRNNTYGLLPS